MPIIRYEKGNLLEKFRNQEFNGLAHGCNCFHTMGAGIADQIAKQFPAALDIDRQTSYAEMNKRGSGSFVWIDDCGYIFNLYTQFYPGKVDTQSLHKAIENCFKDLNIFAMEHFGGKENDFVLGIPKIGCGIAGGDWTKVEKIINDATPFLKIVVCEL